MRRNIMKRAHQIAKTLEGEYRARMSIALRQAWQEAKKEEKKEVLIKVTGNTYPARYILRQAGFVWDKDAKAYFGDESAKAELDRISTASYSRANQKLVAALKIEEIEKDLEEQARKEKKEMKKKYAAYHIDGSKADEFRAAAVKLFVNPELKKELQWRMCNLDRETMSFDIFAGPDTPKDILDLAEKFGVGVNSYA